MLNNTIAKNLLKPLLVLAMISSGCYTLTVQAEGVVTDCSTYGDDGDPSTPAPPLPGTLAAALVGGGEVTFACGDTITVPVTIQIDQDTEIDARGQSGVTLSGGGNVRVLQVNAVELELFNLTITGGSTEVSGAGIRNVGGTVTLNNTIVSGNTADIFGGGIENATSDSTMILKENSTVSGNNALSFGGGIHNQGTMTLNESTVSDNTAVNAAGIQNVGTLTLEENTVVSNNTATNSRGGIYNNQATLTIENSEVSRNSSNGGNGGGIVSDGTLTIKNSTVSNNTTVGNGGGILIERANGAISGTTISGNQAEKQGGGIANIANATLTITNSTISGNSSTNQGGGIRNAGSLKLTNVTVANNEAANGGGLFISSNNPTELINTLIATNITTNGPGGDCGGDPVVVTDSGYNLDSDDTCQLNSSTSLPNTDPQLDMLANNGGPTQTHALSTAPPEEVSPAIDRILPGSNGCGTTITTDQRGVTRPVGPSCDIGAYETTAVAADTTPPIVSGVTANPNPTSPNTEITLTATVDDTTTGGSNVASAEYNIDGGVWTAMDAEDGNFNDESEEVIATLTLEDPAEYTICVRGTDAASNTSRGEDCTTVTIAVPVSKIVVSPSPLDFGDVTVGESSLLPLTISNFGNAAVVIDVPGPDNGAFDWSPINANLAACETPPDNCPSIDLDVTFTPTAKLPFEDTISINNQSGEPLVTAALKGNGVAVPASLSISIREALVRQLVRNPEKGNITVFTDYEGGLPSGSETVSMRFGDIELFSAKFSEFKQTRRNPNIYRLVRRGLLARFEVAKETFYVNSRNLDINLLDLANNNEIDVQVTFKVGDSSAKETITIEQAAKRLWKYKRGK